MPSFVLVSCLGQGVDRFLIIALVYGACFMSYSVCGSVPDNCCGILDAILGACFMSWSVCGSVPDHCYGIR